MAFDKLQALRKDKAHYDIFLMPKDLKVFSKDKRDALAASYRPEEDQAFLDEDAAAEEKEDEADVNGGTAEGSRNVTQQSSATEEVPASGSQPAPKMKSKRRKKASNLSRQANRRLVPGAELSWISNLANNRKI